MKILDQQSKIEELSRFKYQFELIKQLSEEKDSKIKILERDWKNISSDFQELRAHDVSEEYVSLKRDY